MRLGAGASLGRPASDERLPARRGSASGRPRGHAESARSDSLQARRATPVPSARPPWTRRGLGRSRRAASPLAPVGRSSRHLQLTSPKFPAPAPPRPSWRARLGACARLCAAPGAPFSGLLRLQPSGAGAECWRRVLKKTRLHLSSAVCSGAAPAFLTAAAQLPVPGRPAAREAVGTLGVAQVSVATCVWTHPEPALGVHVHPRVSVCISWGMRRRWSPGLREGGGTSAEPPPALTPPGPGINRIPLPALRPLPIRLLLLLCT